MAMDSYSQALQARRGRGMEMIYPEHESEEKAHETALAQGDGTGAGGERQGTPHHEGESLSPAGVTEHMGQHTAPVREGMAPSPTPDRQSLHHEDEHTRVTHQSDGAGGLDGEIRSHVIGHTYPGEAEDMKGMKPRSLGERAKMAAMEKK